MAYAKVCLGFTLLYLEFFGPESPKARKVANDIAECLQRTPGAKASVSEPCPTLADIPVIGFPNEPKERFRKRALSMRQREILKAVLPPEGAPIVRTNPAAAKTIRYLLGRGYMIEQNGRWFITDTGRERISDNETKGGG